MGFRPRVRLGFRVVFRFRVRLAFRLVFRLRVRLGFFRLVFGLFLIRRHISPL